MIVITVSIVMSIVASAIFSRLRLGGSVCGQPRDLP
jgi:hypothetical protein